MNIPNFLLSRNLIFSILIFSIGIFTLFNALSCTKDMVPVKQNTTLTIELAKNIFSSWKNQFRNQTNKSSILSKRTDSTSLNNEKLIHWNEAVLYFDSIKNQSVVEVPITENYPTKYYIPWIETLNPIDSILSLNKRSLIIIEDSLLNCYVTICNIIPSEVYLKNGGNISLNTYKTKESSFSGFVIFTDWEENILDGYAFESGEPTDGYITEIIPDNPNDTTSHLKLRIEGCWNYKICYFELCDKPITFNDSSLNSREVDEYCLVYCEVIVRCLGASRSGRGNGGYGGKGGTNWGGNNNWGGGGGSGGNSNGNGNGSGSTNENPTGFIDRTNKYETECDMNIMEDHEDIAFGCQEICKNKSYAEFRLCITDALIKKGVNISDDCKKKAFGLTQADLDDINNIINTDDVFNIDENPLLKRLNECEKRLLYRHINCARSMSTNKTLAENETKRIFGISGHNNCSDAFRHAYFNALNSKDCGTGSAKLFADAHEICNGILVGPEMEANMDFHNNDIGRNIQFENPNATNAQLSNLILNELINGNLKFIFPRGSNNEIISTSQLISTFQNCD